MFGIPAKVTIGRVYRPVPARRDSAKKKVHGSSGYAMRAARVADLSRNLVVFDLLAHVRKGSQLFP